MDKDIDLLKCKFGPDSLTIKNTMQLILFFLLSITLRQPSLIKFLEKSFLSVFNSECKVLCVACGKTTHKNTQ